MQNVAPETAPTSYQPVDSNVGEQRNGATLMVEAYAIIWLILMGWLLINWFRQRNLDQRILGLEAAIARAELKKAKAG